MEKHIVKVLSVERLTHDVQRIRVAKPKGFSFHPGQATDVAINEERWKNELRPFTFTGLNEDPYLEFCIKSYRDHDGATNRIDTLKAGEELILHDVWGAIHYAGPGTFIAGGAGITPFIAILRQLKQEDKLRGNQLIYSNKTEEDIILKDELQSLLGNKFFNTLTEENNPKYHNGLISVDYFKGKLEGHDSHFYICGPDPMIHKAQCILEELGYSDSLIIIEL